MLIGLSVSFCIQDIANGTVDIDDVDYIIGAINPFRNIDPWDDYPIRQTQLSRFLGRIATTYDKTYWRDLPNARHIFFDLYRSGKILLPRAIKDDEYPKSIIDGHWLDCQQRITPQTNTNPLNIPV